jgi:hypothetical protein
VREDSRAGLLAGANLLEGTVSRSSKVTGFGRRHLAWVSILAALAVVGLGLPGAADSAVAASGPTRTFTATASPQVVAAGQTSSFTFVVTNTASQFFTIGKVIIAVPPGFTNVAPGTASGGHDTWTEKVSTCASPLSAPCTQVGQTRVTAIANGFLGFLALWPGQQLSVSLTATAPTAPTTGTWAVAADVLNDPRDSVNYLPFTQVGRSPGVQVVAGAPAALVLTAPGSTTAGSPVNIGVTSVDQFGNTTAENAGLTVTSTDGQAVLPGSVQLSAGSATFPVTLKTAGPQQVSVTDGTLTGSTTLAVAAAGASALQIQATPTSVQAGGQVSVGVTALDPYGNIAVGYPGTVTISGSPGGGTPASGPLTNGQGSFALTLTTAGTVQLAATDGTLSAHTSVIVTPAPPAQLVVTGAPSPSATAGTPFTVTVSSIDQYGNSTGESGPLTVTSGDSQAVLPSGAALVGGSATFPVTLETAGLQTFTVSDGGLSTTTGVAVAPAPASRLAVSTAPTVQAGDQASIEVTAFDPYGNVATGYPGVVTVSGAPGGGTPASGALTAGVGSFPLTLTTAGLVGITATDGLLTGTTSIHVTPAPATTLVVTGGPSSVAAGTPVGLTVTAQDPFGNTDTSLTGTLAISTTDPTAGPSTAPITDGVGTFSVTLDTAGAQTVSVTTPGAGGTIAGDYVTTVTPIAAMQLALTSAPTAVTAGQAFGVTATIEDKFGNPVGTEDPGTTVSLSLSPTTGSLAGTTSVVSANGVATFAGLSVAKANSSPGYTLTASGPPLTPASAPLAVNAGIPTKLVVQSATDEKTLLASPVATLPFDVAVQAQDAFGNPAVVSTTSPTSLALTASGPGSLTSAGSGTIPAGATSGTITGAVYSVIGNGVVLTASTASPALSGTLSVNVQQQAATTTTSPGTPTTLTSLNPNGSQCVPSQQTPTCAQLFLGNGANGSQPVYLFEGSCIGVSTTCLSNGSLAGLLVDATANFKDANGQPLYTNAHPAKVVISCYVGLCKTIGDTDNDTEDKTEDANKYPLYLNASDTGGSFTKAPLCTKPGVINAGATFCVDLSGSLRDKNKNLVTTLLIAIDFRVSGH